MPKSKNHRFITNLFIVLLLCSCSFDRPKDKFKLLINKKGYTNSMVGKRILLYGDSISSDFYPWYRDELKSLSNAEDIYLAGYAGYTTGMLARDEQLQRIFDYNPDIIICLVGGNDNGQKNTVGSFGATDEPLVESLKADTNFSGGCFIQSVSHMVNRIADHYAYAENKPFIVLCTTLPQKRGNAFNQFSRPENWQRKRDAIVEVCDKYDIKCIDLYNLCNWDFSEEPYWDYPRDITDNRGIFTLDGLHPNEDGYKDMARVIYNEMLE